jgi:hypothetical protein
MQSGIDSWNEAGKQEAEGIRSLDPPLRGFDCFPERIYQKNLNPRPKDWKSLTIFSITILWFGTPNAE